MRLAVVVSRYHEDVTGALLDGAERAFVEAGGDPARLHVVEAPGTFELPVLCAAVIGQRNTAETAVPPTAVPPVDGVIALGCVITGETAHDQYINTAVSSALANLSAQSNVPIGFGVLTCRNMEQARERAGGSKGNKGAEAMTAVIETIRALEKIGAMRSALLDGERG